MKIDGLSNISAENKTGQLIAYMVAEQAAPDLLPSVLSIGQEYHYRIDVQYGMNGGTIELTVFDGPMASFGGGGEDCTNQIFKGTVKEFGEFIVANSD